MQNPLHGFERKGEAPSRTDSGDAQTGASSRILKGSTEKTSGPGMRPLPGSDPGPSDAVRANLHSQPGTAALPAGTSAYEAVRIEVDLPPSLFPSPEILFLGERVSDPEREENRHQGFGLPFLTVRWQEWVLVFQSNDTDFRRMSLEWNGPTLEDGKPFFELLLRLKEYGIEEIYRNGRLISVERQV